MPFLKFYLFRRSMIIYLYYFSNNLDKFIFSLKIRMTSGMISMNTEDTAININQWN